MEVRSGATPSKDEPSFWDGEIPWVSPKDMKVLRIADSEDHVSEAALAHSALRWIAEGSVLMVTRGMILDHTVPISLAMRPLTINQDMKALVPRRVVRGAFLAWLLVGLNPALLARVEEAAHGTKALRTEQWKKLPLAIPPLDDQRRIADFLDRKTAAIDALIAKKEKLVALLAENRQELITRAVTKGLDPSAPMNDSGVNWTDLLPAHWQVKKVARWFGKIGSGTTPDSQNSEFYLDGSVPWVTTSELREREIETTQKSVTTVALAGC
ncbi:Type I restriction-modification system, specificity subunit S [Vulgatibacter incomptus]|uniref:Type I restriction-modification system, specificity subunit S n=1 Tax=Vulgatibacter incomptus TaxID=1391653 RepID=A0A0K1PCE5_9BACT|nr:Type I restriction-modification system, specificity subunit S [Vulgatibacter incomptus]